MRFCKANNVFDSFAEKFEGPRDNWAAAPLDSEGDVKWTYVWMAFSPAMYIFSSRSFQ